MLKVKIFDAEHEADLEEEVNRFLETISESQFNDVKFQVAAAEDTESGEMVCSYSAMVLYRG
ncbi:MAG TPA: sporulation protein Cse60 [Bacillales bacterium]|nr:sporulation protein Cse60 [Bacillales bacterium]